MRLKCVCESKFIEIFMVESPHSNCSLSIYISRYSLVKSTYGPNELCYFDVSVARLFQILSHTRTHTHTQVGRKRPLSERDILLSPQTFCKRREQSEEGHESGTTAVVCLLRGEKVFVANAGDSRCILSSNGGCSSK